MEKVVWKKGTQWKVKPEVAHREIEKIRTKNNGDVTATKVVSAAQKPRNPLHNDFEWDDQKAANEHRLDTARHMLRTLVVVREETKSDRPQRVYEVTRENGEASKQGRKRKVYRTAEDIMRDPDTRAELLSRALRELISIRNRFRDLQELAVVFRAVDELVENINPT